MKDGPVFTLALFAALAGVAVGASPQNNRKPRIVTLPPERTETVQSPDGAWALIAGPIPERTIILENRSDHKQTLIKEYSRSAQIGWSPDSRAFFVNDAYGSNLEDAFIYRVGTKEPLSLNDAIRSGDKEADALPADHAYFRVGRWVGANEVLAEYCGHGGENPIRRFDFIYAVILDGPGASNLRIRRVSRTVKPASLSAPDCSF